jgi:hypothetical protein
LKPIYDFAGNSDLGVWMRNSRYAFPAFEMVHLLGLGLLLGSVLLFNARFFGLGMRRQTLTDVASDFAPWTKLAVVMMVLSGVPLFASKAPDLWREDFAGYTIKMSLIVVAVVFHYAVQIPMARAENMGTGRVAAGFSLLVWFGAAMAGLSIEFL